jgi:hypothetical protein
MQQALNEDPTQTGDAIQVPSEQTRLYCDRLYFIMLDLVLIGSLTLT